MLENDSQIEDSDNSDIAEKLMTDPEDDPVLELKDDQFNEDNELDELYLGEQ